MNPRVDIFLKRVIDVVGSLTIILAISPVFILVSICNWWSFGRPIFFSQDRPGYRAKIFRLYKFRTMTSETDEHGVLLPDANRLTRYGKFLRSTSLDEIPSLFLVLKGDLSLVGPRPLLVRYLDRYSQVQARRHEVKPGITGWAQVNGRNSISWDEKLALDVWYVDNRSIWLDIKTILLTVKSVLVRENISHEEHATMPEFTGSQNKSSDQK